MAVSNQSFDRAHPVIDGLWREFLGKDVRLEPFEVFDREVGKVSCSMNFHEVSKWRERLTQIWMAAIGCDHGREMSRGLAHGHRVVPIVPLSPLGKKRQKCLPRCLIIFSEVMRLSAKVADPLTAGLVNSKGWDVEFEVRIAV